MERYQHLLKKRNRALGLFARVVRRLLRLEAEIEQAMGLSAKKIDDAKSVISEETQAIDCLKEHLEQTKIHRTRIETFLPRG